MSPQFSDLPSEVIEMVVCLLHCRDICNLRLVSRYMDAASTQAHYKSFFVSKEVELGSNAISECAAILRHSRFAGLLQDLTLTGTEKLQRRDRFSTGDVDTLCMAFRDLYNLYKRSNQYGLRTLTAGLTDSEFAPSGVSSELASRSAAGAQAVRTTLHVANDSDIPIESIDLLYHPLACSVPCCIFEAPFGSVKPSSNWSALRCLSLSLTYHVRTGANPVLNCTDSGVIESLTYDSADAVTRRVEALVDFFSLLPNIEELDLHWYNNSLLRLIQPRVISAEKYWLNQVSLAVSFHKLKTLVLRGLHVTQSCLEKLLTAPSLQQVHLEYIHLTGSFRPILDILIGGNTAISQFYLDDIYERRLVHFRIRGSPKFPYHGWVPGPSTVLRKGEEVRLPLEYEVAGVNPLVSQEIMDLWERRREMFG